MMMSDIPRQGDIAFQANLYDDPNPTRRGLHLRRRQWVEAAIISHLAPGARVLEVGIGCGVFTRFLSALGAAVTAVDINPAFVAGVAGLPRVTPVLADATKRLDLGYHDLVVCSEVLEHVARDRSIAMLDTLAASLAPGGLLVLTTPQRFAMVELMARLLKLPPMLALARRIYGNADALGHINLLTASTLEQQFRAAGLSIQRRARFGFYLPVIAEVGGERGRALLERIGNVLAGIPLVRGLLWTQAYILQRS